MNDRINNTVQELNQVADDARSAFGGFSSKQLNWKPSPKSWSVAQCLDHLIVTHSLMFPVLQRLSSGDARSTFWEKHSPLSGFFGRFLIRGLDPKNLKPMKTTSKAVPSSGDIGGDIVERYLEHQRKMIEAVEKLPRAIDPKTTVIRSPLLGFVTYSLDDWFTIITYHGRRHFNQAKRVTEAAGFPDN